MEDKEVREVGRDPSSRASEAMVMNSDFKVQGILALHSFPGSPIAIFSQVQCQVLGVL